MSFCRLCGAGFQFVGEHKPGCEAVTPKPPAAPELPEGWVPHFSGYRLPTKGGWHVDSDTDANLHVCRAYHLAEQYSEGVRIPLPILRALLATQGLHIVSEKDREVLEAVASASLEDSDLDADPLEPQELGEDCYLYTDDQARIVRAELARREGKP